MAVGDGFAEQKFHFGLQIQQSVNFVILKNQCIRAIIIEILFSCFDVSIFLEFMVKFFAT